eukprot:4381732-Amphidinium_carterae.1
MALDWTLVHPFVRNRASCYVNAACAAPSTLTWLWLPVSPIPSFSFAPSSVLMEDEGLLFDGIILALCKRLSVETLSILVWMGCHSSSLKGWRM